MREAEEARKKEKKAKRKKGRGSFYLQIGIVMKTLKRILQTLWDMITYPYIRIRDEIRFKKKLKELRKRDPFIYK